MSNWIKRIFSVNPEWCDPFLSMIYRPKSDGKFKEYTSSASASSFQYYSRDGRRSLPQNISVLRAEGEALHAVKITGAIPGEAYKWRQSGNVDSLIRLFK